MSVVEIVFIVIGTLLLCGGVFGAIFYEFYLKKKGIVKKTKPNLIEQSTNQFYDFFNKEKKYQNKKIVEAKKNDLKQNQHLKELSKEQLEKKYRKIIEDFKD